jgi:dynein heavy chain
MWNILSTSLEKEKFVPLGINFSAQTSANTTQDQIDQRMDKRCKGHINIPSIVYGPPVGKRAIVFVDDLNMPAVEEYGAQPPLELLRQLLDHNGWYDLQDKGRGYRTMVDTQIACAMGPPGGGRNHVAPRLLRHFNIICLTEFDDETLHRIFSTVMNWYLEPSLPDPIRALSAPIVTATMEVYKTALAKLLPTPTKSHYIFNLRDFSRVIQGILLADKDMFRVGGKDGVLEEGISAEEDNDTLVPDDLRRLWIYEVF